MTDEDIKTAIKSCKLRNTAMGVPICVGEQMPCELAIDHVKCWTLKELFAKEDEK